MIVGLRIAILAAAHTAALGYMIADRLSVVNSDTVVTLKVQPVDPRDMFRGDYVVLSYDISRLDTGKLDGDDSFTPSLPVYVTLAEQNGASVPIAVHRERPAPAAGQVVLRGTVDSSYSAETGTPPTLTVTYGIESFFVPQGEGKEIEAERQKGEITVDVAIAADGRTAIKALRRQGQVIHTESLF